MSNRSMRRKIRASVGRLTPERIEALCHEIYAVHHGFTVAGYSLDQVRAEVAFVPNAEVPGLNITVQLRRGVLEPFVYVVAPIRAEDVPAMTAAWAAFGSRFNQLSQPERDALFEATQFRQEAVGFFAALALAVESIASSQPVGVA